jgi:ABC-type proline/glycine betaine transport system permease subunit
LIDGLQRSFPTEVIVGLVAVIVLAVVCDLLLVGVRRLLTPWQPRRQVALAQWPGLQRAALLGRRAA